MTNVVRRGYAIDNGETVDSPKYKIQILGKGSPSSPRSSTDTATITDIYGLLGLPFLDNEKTFHGEDLKIGDISDF